MNLKLLIYFLKLFNVILFLFIYFISLVWLKFKYALKNTLNTWEKKNKTKSWWQQMMKDNSKRVASQ